MLYEQYIIHAKENKAILILSGCILNYRGERNQTTTTKRDGRKEPNNNYQKGWGSSFDCGIRNKGILFHLD